MQKTFIVKIQNELFEGTEHEMYRHLFLDETIPVEEKKFVEAS